MCLHIIIIINGGVPPAPQRFPVFPRVGLKRINEREGGTLYKTKNNICRLAYYIIIIQRVFCFPGNTIYKSHNMI